MNDYEKNLLNDKSKLCILYNLLENYQYSEEFLIQTIGYYDSWRCLKTQKNLSPYFCFRYLYDNDTDSADNWTDYYDVIRYLKKTKTYTDEFIEKEFERAMKDRGRIKE